MRRRLEQDREFRKFVADFLPTLLRGAYLLTHDVDLAEDVVQGTLLRVFRRWDHARENPEAYTRQTLISVCRDHWRRQRRRPLEVPEHEASIAGRTASFSEDVERREALDQALAALPYLQREVLVLRYFFDFSVTQTAELLDVPEGSVKSATHRGLEQLRGLLAPLREVSTG